MKGEHKVDEMTRLEKIKSMTREEMADLFCHLWLESANIEADTIDSLSIRIEKLMLNCTACPMSNKCSTEAAGWEVYLDGEWDDRFKIGM